MSRTWKDRPVRIMLQENMKKGLIDHEHSGMNRPDREGVSSHPDRDMSATFYKKDTADIAEYIEWVEWLVEEGYAGHYEVEERAGYRQYTNYPESFEYEWTPKTVVINVYRRYVYEHQPYCTDYEHYDSLTGTDKRNGKRAVCTPEWTEEISQRWYSRTHNRNSRAAVKQALHNALREIDMDDLEDEGYSDPVYELERGRKLYMD